MALIGALGVTGYYEHAYAKQSRALDLDAAALRHARWERPVLRGPAGDGNAAEQIYAALLDWKPLEAALRHRLAEELFYGEPVDDGERAELGARSLALHALRAASQQRWSQTELAPERGEAMRVPAYPLIAEAVLGLLAEAASSSPEACLQEGADAIRIGQDLVPGAPLEAASTASHLDALCARVIVRCAARADLASLGRAAHELHVLATHPAPVGSSIALEELAAASELRKQAALTNKPVPLGVARALLERPQLMAAWSLHDDPARFRSITPEKYPDALEDWKREQDFRTQAGSTRQAEQASYALGRLLDDMRGQAIVRMLAVAVSALAERAYRGALPAQLAALRDPALCDPFRGQPLHYRLAKNGAEFTLWSVGEDYHDDGGADDWSESAPRDVTLHVPLREDKPSR